MAIKFLNRAFFQRIFGVPATPQPLDPQCCSVGKSTYTYNGKKIYGPPTRPVKTFELEAEAERLIVFLA